MPPAAFNSWTASALQAVWVGPKSDAGPDSEKNVPILMGSAAFAVRTQLGKAVNDAPAATPARTCLRETGLRMFVTLTS